MANLLLVLAFVIVLFYGYRMMDKLDQFLKAREFEDEDKDE